MDFMEVTWLDETAKGWTDVIPMEWFANAPNGLQSHVFMKKRGSGASSKDAWCTISRTASAMNLDYSSKKAKALNETTGAEIGVLRLKFTGEANNPIAVYWKNLGSRFVPKTVLITYSDEPWPLERLSKEGKKQLKLHWARERNSSLARRKIKSVLAKNLPVNCEACDFNFEQHYGLLGMKFCEVHHVEPLAEVGPRLTGLDDLALLCSNCHRMIHRTYPIEDIKKFRKRLKRPRS